MSEWLGWHFLPGDCRLANGDGREVKVGETYTVDGEPALCCHGLHASRRALDALGYAPGPVACRVRLGGQIVEGDDKACATERTVLGMADATRTLHEFALWCTEKALGRANVTDEQPWRALEVKRKWLDGEATEEELIAAREAAQGVSCYAARTVAEVAARTAAEAATWDVASATYDATWNAAEVADADAWDAVLLAAEAATEAAMRGVWNEQNAELERRLLALLEEESALAGSDAYRGRGGGE